MSATVASSMMAFLKYAPKFYTAYIVGGSYSISHSAKGPVIVAIT